MCKHWKGFVAYCTSCQWFQESHSCHMHTHHHDLLGQMYIWSLCSAPYHPLSPIFTGYTLSLFCGIVIVLSIFTMEPRQSSKPPQALKSLRVGVSESSLYCHNSHRLLSFWQCKYIQLFSWPSTHCWVTYPTLELIFASFSGPELSKSVTEPPLLSVTIDTHFGPWWISHGRVAYPCSWVAQCFTKCQHGLTSVDVIVLPASWGGHADNSSLLIVILASTS